MGEARALKFYVRWSSMAFVYGVLVLFDEILRAMLAVPLLAFFLAGMLVFAALGLFLLLKDAASGQGRRK